MISKRVTPSWLAASRAVVLLLALDALVVLFGQIDRDLVTVDDLREAEVAREMYVSGDYVVPTLASLPFVEKPSGFPAVVATAYRLAGGPSVVAARLVSATFALATLFAVFLLGRRLFGSIGGAIATTILALSPRFCTTAHEILLDNALTATLAFALLFFWISLDTVEPQAKRRAYTGMMLMLGLSFLVKGFVGLALFGSGTLFYFALTKRWKEFLYWIRPLPLLAFFAPMLLWLVPFLMRATPHLVHDFFIANTVGRALEAYASHDRPFYFYLETIWYNFPAAIFLPFVLMMLWRYRLTPETRGGTFLFAMAGGAFLFLSLVRAKDAVYLLPAYPALSLLVAWWGVRIFSEPKVMAKVLAWFTFATMVFTLVWVLFFAGFFALEKVEKPTWRQALPPILDKVGSRDLLLYRPDDECRGACGFYRHRTAYEVNEPTQLIEHLRQTPQAVVLIGTNAHGDIPQELVGLNGVELVEELRTPYYSNRLVLMHSVVKK